MVSTFLMIKTKQEALFLQSSIHNENNVFVEINTLSTFIMVLS